MGLNHIGIRLQLYARRSGVAFSRTAMIGRQALFIENAALASLLQNYGYLGTEEQALHIRTARSGFSEPLFEMLGADEVASIDISAYEQATILLDLNQPLPDASLAGRFTALVEAGSLEHVFNFPQAIKNCMEMIAVGGHFVGPFPTNNYCGHGFYQLSPELFFRVFSPENGFVMEKVFLVEHGRNPVWYEVVDPETAQRRGEFANWRKTFVMCIARRIAVVPIFAKPPYQSDYVVAWETGAYRAGLASHGLLREWQSRLWSRLPDRVRGACSKLHQRLQKVTGPGTLFQRFDPQLYRRADLP